MDPTQSVRIKYVSDAGIEARVTGGVVPRSGEWVRLQHYDGAGDVHRHQWFEVDGVFWEVAANTREPKPDVVTVEVTKKYDKREPPGDTQPENPDDHETVRSESLRQLADRVNQLIADHGGDTPVKTNADDVVLPSVATTYNHDEDRVEFH